MLESAVDDFLELVVREVQMCGVDRTPHKRRVDSAQLDTVLLAEVPSFPFLQRLGQCVCGAETAVRWLARATATAAERQRDRNDLIGTHTTAASLPASPCLTSRSHRPPVEAPH